MSAYILDFAGKPVGIADIDDKIQSLHDDIAFLQRLRNSRLIVGRIIATLPDDILIMIFQSVHGLLSAGDRAESPVKVCLGLTHVCQRWRNILLSTAQFWSTVYTSIPAELIPLWLGHSGDLLPLHLTSARRRVEVKDTVNLVLTQQAHRLKTIQLMPKGDISTLYKDALEQIQEAPFLETLALTTQVRPTTEHIKFSPSVQDDLTPPLHSLALRNCIVDLNVPFFSPLRTLNIQYQSQFKSYGNLQIPRLISALGMMQQLEDLSLIFAVKPMDDGTLVAKITLPNLKTFHIRTVNLGGLDVLLHLSCPSLQTLYARSSSTSPTSLTPIATAFHSLIPTSVTFDALSPRLSVRSRDSGYATILEYSTGGRCGRKITAAFVLHIFTSEDNAGATLQAICVRQNGRMIPTIIHLDNSFESFVGYNPLWHFLEDHSSHIETLVLDAGLWMLTYGPRSDEDDDPAKYTSILPSLKHLIVIGASFHERGLLEYQRLLRARTVSGTRIETLTLHCQTQSDAEGWEVLKADVCSLEVTCGEWDLKLAA